MRTLLFFSIFLFLSCHAFSATFDSIHANGHFNIVVKTGAVSRVQINSPLESYVVKRVEDNKLYLGVDFGDNTPPPDYPPIQVVVQMPMLNDLELSDQVTVMGNDIQSAGLRIYAQGCSHIFLTGVLSVSQIEAAQESDISLRWVDSHHLSIFAMDNARIFLAGVAQVMQARLAGEAELQAKYMRPKSLFVQTQQNSMAEVLSVKDMYAFAYDNSNIYFYKSPDLMVRSTHASGNALQMGLWH